MTMEKSVCRDIYVQKKCLQKIISHAHTLSKKIMVRPLWVPHISMSYYDSTDKRISHDTRNNEYRSYCRYCYVICFVHIGMRAVFVSSLKNKTKQLCHSE